MIWLIAIFEVIVYILAIIGVWAILQIIGHPQTSSYREVSEKRNNEHYPL
jgi:uncharacterized membrane protein